MAITPSFKGTGSFANADVSSKGFFDALRMRSGERSEEVVLDFTDKMLAILRNRRSLGGDARYPRWTPTSSEPHSSLKSFAQWRKMSDPKGKYQTRMRIYNPALSRAGFNYPAVLISGVGAPKSWGKTADRGFTKKGEPAKVVRNGGMVFSKQMPQGLDPWLLLKRAQLKQELEAMLKTRNRY